MQKQALRELYKSQRKALSEIEHTKKSRQIANQLLKLPIWHHLTFHVFCSITKYHEVDTTYILSILMGRDKNIVVPKADFKTLKMNSILLTDSTKFKINQWGIPEPLEGLVIDDSQIEVVIIPLLISDSLGYRVGYGKGFYDRFLAQCKPTVIKVGINFFEPIKQITDVDITDLKLNWLVTPNQILEY